MGRGGAVLGPVQLLPAGIVLMRYLGDVEESQLPAASKGGPRYRYGAIYREFYVDAQDVSITLAWSENGTKVFEVADD